MEIFALTTINSADQFGRKIVIEDSNLGLLLDYNTGVNYTGGIHKKVLMGSAQLHERAIVYKYILDNYKVDYDTYLANFNQGVDAWYNSIPQEASTEEGISDAQA